MMKKEIKFSLVYRDMWQSSGKYQPRVDQLVRIAPLIVEMGCFARVETNGGAFEQVNLLYGENPNKAVRAFTAPFREAGIQTHMLDRGLNALRMYPVPADVRRLMYKVKHAQGVDITRIFCGLNETRNIIPSIKYALEAGMIPQATLCITYSPVHTVEYYASIADRLIEAGAPEICLKDMAGIGRPGMLGQLVRTIKEKHPDVLIQYHGHSGPGLSMASILEVCENGADIIDVAMEPMSWGKVHPDIISVQAMLKDLGFQVPDINMKAYMKARAMTQEFIDEFLGYFMDPTNKQGQGVGVVGAAFRYLQRCDGLHIDQGHAALGQVDVVGEQLIGQTGQIGGGTGSGLDHAVGNFHRADGQGAEQGGQLLGVGAELALVQLGVDGGGVHPYSHFSTA